MLAYGAGSSSKVVAGVCLSKLVIDKLNYVQEMCVTEENVCEIAARDLSLPTKLGGWSL